MEEWYCFKDKVKMEERDVWLSYMNLTQSILGLRCPKCGAAYLTEEKIKIVNDGEAQIESK